MNMYEHIFMARQDVSSQQVDALVEQFKGVLESNGGKVGKIENWGLKNLPYRVKKNKKAHYALMNVTAPPDAIKEMERQMRLHEDIIRYLTVRVEEHEEGPSAMLRKNEKDERTDERTGERTEGRVGERMNERVADQKADEKNDSQNDNDETPDVRSEEQIEEQREEQGEEQNNNSSGDDNNNGDNNVSDNDEAKKETKTENE